MRKRLPVSLALAVLVAGTLCLLGIVIYNLPPIHQRLAWRVERLRTQVKYTLNPPEAVVFVPQEQVEPVVRATLTALAPTVTSTAVPTLAATPGPTATPIPTATPTLVPTPIPEKVMLAGIRHEYEKMNNCGPATLSMNLSYWGWTGDQLVTRAFLRPNPEVDDKNVMPAELANYVNTQTDMKALVRVGGDLPLLKRLIAAGFPVIIEKGFQPGKEFWMGHYVLLNGYDDGRGRFISQDSYIMADFPIPYTELEGSWWRDFNYTYLVVYPPEREAEVFALLGVQADPLESYRAALQRAVAESERLAGRDLYFAWYNRGTNLVGLQDYAGAAAAYDQAFAVYPAISERNRPWRMLWYQIGPYQAYYETGRYADVINLADTTFQWIGAPVLEETFYWRGLAHAALGDLEKGVADLKKAAALNPGSTNAVEQLRRLGVEYP